MTNRDVYFGTWLCFLLSVTTLTLSIWFHNLCTTTRSDAWPLCSAHVVRHFQAGSEQLVILTPPYLSTVEPLVKKKHTHTFHQVLHCPENLLYPTQVFHQVLCYTENWLYCTQVFLQALHCTGNWLHCTKVFHQVLSCIKNWLYCIQVFHQVLCCTDNGLYPTKIFHQALQCTENWLYYT